MGRSYLFECPRCGYKAKVSGGPDAGIALRVQTILCRDCKALYDAVTRFKMPDYAGPQSVWGFVEGRRRQSAPGHPPVFEVVVNRLFFGGNTRSRWVPFRLRCPVSGAHRVRVWNEPGRCPKCGTYLEKNTLPFRIWE